MEQDIRRVLIGAAREAGWTARRDGRSQSECPYQREQREAWIEGWRRANLQMF